MEKLLRVFPSIVDVHVKSKHFLRQFHLVTSDDITSMSVLLKMVLPQQNFWQIIMQICMCICICIINHDESSLQHYYIALLCYPAWSIPTALGLNQTGQQDEHLLSDIGEAMYIRVNFSF